MAYHSEPFATVILIPSSVILSGVKNLFVWLRINSASFPEDPPRRKESRLLLTCNNQILRFTQDDKKSLCHSLFPSFHSDPGTLLIHLYTRPLGPLRSSLGP